MNGPIRCGTGPLPTARETVSARVDGPLFDSVERLRDELAAEGLTVSRAAVVRALMTAGLKSLRGGVKALRRAL